MPIYLNITPVNFFQLHILLSQGNNFDLRRLQNFDAMNDLINDFDKKVKSFEETYVPKEVFFLC